MLEINKQHQWSVWDHCPDTQLHTYLPLTGEWGNYFSCCLCRVIYFGNNLFRYSSPSCIYYIWILYSVRINFVVSTSFPDNQGWHPVCMVPWAHKNWNCTPSSFGIASRGTQGAVRALFSISCHGPGSSKGNIATLPASKEAVSPSRLFHSIPLHSIEATSS